MPNKKTNHETHDPEETYNKIIGFYDLAEELVSTVEDEDADDPVAQLEFIEPLVKHIEKATDVLADEYRTFIKTGKTPNFIARRKVAKSLKNTYSALSECKQALKDAGGNLLSLPADTINRAAKHLSELTETLASLGILGPNGKAMVVSAQKAFEKAMGINNKAGRGRRR